MVDDKQFKAHLGCWMFYLPKLQAKLFHAKNGMIDCTRAPDLNNISDIQQPMGRYIAADWLNALQTPINRRLAEIWLVSARLWRAGLGPQPLGICLVDKLIIDSVEMGPTCGLLTQNVHKLPRKLDCKLEQIVKAGVVPDHILSCVRQQLRGYVTDLCSVKGCQPFEAEDEVKTLEKLFNTEMPDNELIQALEKTLNRP